MTDPHATARTILTDAGFRDIGGYNGGASGTKQRFAAIRAHLFMFAGSDTWTAEILHDSGVLGKGASHDPYVALQDAIRAATRRTSSILDIVIHTLGLDNRRREPWRNHYITGADDAAMAELVAAGLMEPVRRPGWLAAEDFPYRATEAGKVVAVAENDKRNPKPSRSRARYLHYLYRADAYGCSFGEYLRRGLYKAIS